MRKKLLKIIYWCIAEEKIEKGHYCVLLENRHIRLARANDVPKRTLKVNKKKI